MFWFMSVKEKHRLNKVLLFYTCETSFIAVLIEETLKTVNKIGVSVCRKIFDLNRDELIY